ncbi:MAG: PAS domain S-box protein [Desulfobacterales bacterium]
MNDSSEFELRDPRFDSNVTPAGASSESLEELRRRVAELEARASDLEAENGILRDALAIKMDQDADASDELDIFEAGLTAGGVLESMPLVCGMDCIGGEAEGAGTASDPGSLEALNCLYEVSRLTSGSDKSLEQVLQEIAERLPGLWPSPGAAGVRIAFGKRVFGEYPDSPERPALASELFLAGRTVGFVGVLRDTDRDVPPGEQTPPPDVDVQLLRAIAEKINTLVARHHQAAISHRSETRFRKIFATSPDGIAISRLEDGRFLDVNEGFALLSGFEREEVIGKSSIDIHAWVPPELRTRFIRELTANKTVRNFEAELRRKDGFVITALISATLIELDGQANILSVIRDITLLKQTESALLRQRQDLERQNAVLRKTQAELEASRERYSDLYHSAPVGYLTFDRNCRIVNSNRTAARLLGCDSSELERTPFLDFLVPEDRQAFFGHIQKVFDSGNRQVCEIRMFRRLKGDFHARIESAPQFDDDGQTVLCRTTISDNSEFKKAELALQASYRFLRIASSLSSLEPTLEAFIREIKSLTGCTAAGIRLLEGDGAIPYAANDGFCESFLKLENPISIHSDECMCIRVICGEVDSSKPYFTGMGSFFTQSTGRLATELSAGNTIRTRDACNRFGYESVALIPVRAENRVIGLIHVADIRKGRLPLETVQLLENAGIQLGAGIQRMWAEAELRKANERLEERVAERAAEVIRSNEQLKNEVRERRRAETLLLEQQGMLQAVFDGISDPLILADKDLRVLMVNSAAVRYLKLQDQKTVIGRTCREVMRHNPEACDACQMPQAVDSGRIVTFERDGFIDPSRQEQVVVYPVSGSETGKGRVVIRINDITESRLLERQIIQSEKLASLGMLVSSVAHELNNPNSFIAFNVPILKEYFNELLPIVDRHAAENPDFEVLNMPYAEFRKDAFRLLENLTHGSQRIDAFLGNLREFARTHPDTAMKWVDLKEVVDRALAICRSKIQKTVKTLDIRMPAGRPRIYSNAGTLEQILINLLVNAAQAADKKDSWIRMAIARTDDPEPGWRITVSDNGCGMDEKTRLQIFDPFFSTKLNEGGSGLGLYVCRRLLRDISGTIQAESRAGEGSTFTVTLPDRGPQDS